MSKVKTGIVVLFCLATISTASEFTWTPTPSQVGEWNPIFTATDDKGAIASQSVKIIVAPGDGVCNLNEFAQQTGDIDALRAFVKLWGYGWPKKVSDDFYIELDNDYSNVWFRELLLMKVESE